MVENKLHYHSYWLKLFFVTVYVKCFLIPLSSFQLVMWIAGNSFGFFFWVSFIQISQPIAQKINWHELVVLPYIFDSPFDSLVLNEGNLFSLGNTLCAGLTNQNQVHLKPRPHESEYFLKYILFVHEIDVLLFSRSQGVRSPKPHYFQSFSREGFKVQSRPHESWWIKYAFSKCPDWCGHGLSQFAKSVTFLQYVPLSLLFLVCLNVKPEYHITVLIGHR